MDTKRSVSIVEAADAAVAPKPLVLARFAQPEEKLPVSRGELVLPFEQRQKSRLVVQLTNGTDVLVRLARGRTLREGDVLMAEDERGCAVVRAATEPLTAVRVADPWALARLTYHLGNRHIPVQIELGRIYYQQDPVIDTLVQRLGFEPERVTAPFEPESGAYGSGLVHEHGHAH
jgi:urease accessory protein